MGFLSWLFGEKKAEPPVPAPPPPRTVRVRSSYDATKTSSGLGQGGTESPVGATAGSRLRQMATGAEELEPWREAVLQSPCVGSGGAGTPEFLPVRPAVAVHMIDFKDVPVSISAAGAFAAVARQYLVPEFLSESGLVIGTGAAPRFSFHRRASAAAAQAVRLVSGDGRKMTVSTDLAGLPSRAGSSAAAAESHAGVSCSARSGSLSVGCKTLHAAPAPGRSHLTAKANSAGLHLRIRLTESLKACLARLLHAVSWATALVTQSCGTPRRQIPPIFRHGDSLSLETRMTRPSALNLRRSTAAHADQGQQLCERMVA